MLGKVVFVRHGESQGNAQNVYTGWGDTPLSVRGEQEANEAGLVLKAQGLKFDVVFTSVLARATKTCEICCNASGNRSVPVIKSWRLNARHSGGLAGLTQAEAVAKYGEAKVTLWRSSYDVLPACVELDDPRHPFNDPLYKDVPREQLPAGGESLKCTVDRVVPFWVESIVPRIRAGEMVLVVAHKNSLRALWKYLENTPDDEALDIKMPNASAPLVFEFEVNPNQPEAEPAFAKKYNLNAPVINPNVMSNARAHSKLILLRHGEAVGNAKGVYTGWEDTSLTLKGEQQAIEAGLCLKKKGVKIDYIFTSVLKRAVKTAELACNISENSFARPVVKSWRLNARHNGVLEGLSEADAKARYGKETVDMWRSSFEVAPGPVEESDQRHPVNDPLYADVPREDLPACESMVDVCARIKPIWEEQVKPQAKAGKCVLLVCHKNAVRGLLNIIDDSDDSVIEHIAASTLPYVCELSEPDAAGEVTVIRKYRLTADALQLGQAVKPVGKAVFLRHGESECNLKEAFTGWENSGMTPKGNEEAVEAGRYLKEEGFKFDVVFTSFLNRAVESADIILTESGNTSVPVIKNWRLNARHPGVLQGMTKPEAIAIYGKAKVNVWRGSYDVMPECVSMEDPRHPAKDPLYAEVPMDLLPPGGESLARTLDRIVVCWQDLIAPRIRAGDTVLIVGHKNSLKALFMYLEDTSEHDMFDLKPVSSTAPLVFEFGDGGVGAAGGLTILKKYWVKHTEAEAIEKSRCKSGAMHM